MTITKAKALAEQKLREGQILSNHNNHPFFSRLTFLLPLNPDQPSTLKILQIRPLFITATLIFLYKNQKGTLALQRRAERYQNERSPKIHPLRVKRT